MHGGIFNDTTPASLRHACAPKDAEPYAGQPTLQDPPPMRYNKGQVVVPVQRKHEPPKERAKRRSENEGSYVQRWNKKKKESLDRYAEKGAKVKKMPKYG